MKQEVLPNTMVQQALGQYLYHVVDLDLEPAFAKKFGITALPTIMILDGDERVQKQQVGYMTVDVLVNWLGRP
ncbi:thioredoxin family protein, partial [Acinetobacter baumannii]